MSIINANATSAKILCILCLFLFVFHPSWEASLITVFGITLVGIELVFEKRSESEIKKINIEIQKLKDRIDSIQLARLSR